MTGIYVHIPYCVSKCIYCNFCSYTQTNYQAYTNAVAVELRKRAHNVGKIDTIYFGGGTPTLLPIQCMTTIVNEIRNNYSLADNVEMSIECNPNSATADKISNLVKMGFNRFSVGLQCANDDILRLIGRPHTVKNFVDTVHSIQHCGVTNINCDLMLGLPTQATLDLDKSLELVLSLDIPHISAYALKVEKGTPLYNMVNSGKVKIADDDSVTEMYDYVMGKLAEHNLYRYEISNFAKKGYECQHNLIYWHCDDYVGIGCSAHGLYKNMRYSNTKRIDKYIEKLGKNILPTVTRESLALSDRSYEYVMLSLRLDSGMNIASFKNRFDCDFWQTYPHATALVDKGLLVIDGDIIRIPNRYSYVMNEILVELLYD